MLLILFLQISTSKSVALTGEILPAVYGTLVAAVLSLGASIYATIRTAQTAQLLKEKDYKNDFYKKVIDKRLKAWEEAEILVSLVLKSTTDIKDMYRLPAYFASVSEFDNVLNKMGDASLHAFWMGKEYAKAFYALHKRLYSLRRNCMLNDMPAIDADLLLQAGKENYLECKSLTNNIVKSLGKQLPVLHELDEFFQDLKHIAIEL